MKLLGISHKTEVGNKSLKRYISKIQYLAPHTKSGYNVCQHASIGCSSACLNLSGRGRMNTVQQARIKRTKLFFENRLEYNRMLYKELESFVRSAEKQEKQPCVRLNGTSDLPWESLLPSIFDYPIRFYDYTKNFRRMLNFCQGELPKNYHLTFSRSEVNQNKCEKVLKEGGHVAVVFRSPRKEWMGYPTTDGDRHDLRFLDRNSVVMLKPKAKAKKDETGFVI